MVRKMRLLAGRSSLQRKAHGLLSRSGLNAVLFILSMPGAVEVIKSNFLRLLCVGTTSVLRSISTDIICLSQGISCIYHFIPDYILYQVCIYSFFIKRKNRHGLPLTVGTRIGHLKPETKGRGLPSSVLIPGCIYSHNYLLSLFSCHSFSFSSGVFKALSLSQSKGRLQQTLIKSVHMQCGIFGVCGIFG